MWAGGYPIPGPDGEGVPPSQVLTGGVPHLRSGWGGPHPADGGTPIQDQDGVPHQDWMGYAPPPSRDISP